MTLVLDTSVLISLERREAKVAARLEELSETHTLPPYITFINLFEFLLGVRLKPPRKRREVIAFVKQFDTLNTTDRTSELLADLKAKYDKRGTILPLADIIIAGLVIENGMTLFTKDRDFGKIEELKAEII